jgi:predicted nucleotidyltransferase
MHPNIPKTVEPLIGEFQKLAFVEMIILFGSRAFGDHEERSDIDIALLGKISRQQWVRLRERAYQYRTLYWVSIVHWDRNPQALQRRILETGVIIYDKKATGQSL